MSYAIVGFGRIGHALAHAFARNNINVTVASRRSPEELAPQARSIGPTVIAKSLQDALKADTIRLPTKLALLRWPDTWKPRSWIAVLHLGLASLRV